MRNLLAFLAALTITIIGLGWYLDWFKVRRVPTEDGHKSFTVDFNGAKIGADVQRGARRVQGWFGSSSNEESSANSTQTPEKSAPPKAEEPPKPGINR